MFCYLLKQINSNYFIKWIILKTTFDDFQNREPNNFNEDYTREQKYPDHV